MLRMSFYDGTLDRNAAKEFVQKINKPCVYTYGLSYRRPMTHRAPISKERALEIIVKKSLLDITEEEKVIHLNAYSENDMW